MIEYASLAKRNAMHAEEIGNAVKRVLDSGWYLLGNELNAFEKEYSGYIGTQHCVGVGNGLDALTLIYRAYIQMGLMQPGDEVIVPANTYIASILAVTENQLVPVPVEPDKNSLQIDPTLIQQHISPKTRSIMIVHLYGRCAFNDEIGELCKKYNLLLVEDNAQAHGCLFHGKRTGALGHAAAHSFYPTKNLGAMGDAGAVTTDNPALADTIMALRNYGSSRKYVFDSKGRNSRMDEIQAAVLRAKLPFLDEDNDRRRRIADFYIQNIKNDEVMLPMPATNDNVWHIFPIMCKDRAAFRAYAEEMGVETQIHYPIPPHKQKCMGEWADYKLPVTEWIHYSEVSLPMGPELTDYQVEKVVGVVNSFKKPSCTKL